jgi:hypothetical protein
MTLTNSLQDTFPPLAVRCECQWLETKYVPHCRDYRKCTNLDRNETVVQKQQTSNTFCVPEDDDDDDDNEYDDDDNDENDCEITSHNPVALDLTGDQSSESNASSVDSDSEEDSHSVIEIQSPTSSPPKNDETKDSHAIEPPMMATGPISKSLIEQNNERSEDPEQPLATPRMTPPSVDYESEDPNGENQYYDECFAHSSDDEGSDVDSEGWALNAEVDDAADDTVLEPCDNTHFPTETLEGVSNATPVAQTSSLDCLKKAAVAEHLPNDILGSWNVPPFYGMNRLPEIKFNTPFQQAEQSVASMSHPSPPRLPSLCQTFERVGSNMEPSFQYGHSAEHLSAAVPSHGYTPMPADTTKASFSPQVDSSSGQSSQLSSTHYKDGPFASTNPIVRTKSTSVSCSSKPEILPFMDPLAPMIPRLSCDVFPEPETEKPLASEEWKTFNTGSEKTTTKKRKAPEMESEPVEVVKTVELANKKADISDIQNQDVTTAIDQQGTQITAVGVIKAREDVERPTKRAKASRTTSLRSHATTAIIGAVVGAVGTIAALASLPPDYFA